MIAGQPTVLRLDHFHLRTEYSTGRRSRVRFSDLDFA